MYDNPEITEGENTAVIQDGDKWFYCPICKKKLAKYKSFSVAAAVYVICRGCKNVVEIKI